MYFVSTGYLGLRPRRQLTLRILEHLLFPVHQRIYIVCGQLKAMSMRYRIRGTRLYAIPAKDTPRIIDVVDLRISLARRDPALFRVLRRFNVNAIRWAGRRAQKTSHTLLEVIFVAMQNVNPAISWLEIHGLVRIILRHRLPEHVFERNREALYQRYRRSTNFS